MENNNEEETFPRFENKGSIQYLEQFNKKTDKAKSVINTSFVVVILIIIFGYIFNFLSDSEIVIGLLIVSLIFIIFNYLFGLIMLENFYTRAKIEALKDQIIKK